MYSVITNIALDVSVSEIESYSDTQYLGLLAQTGKPCLNNSDYTSTGKHLNYAK